MIETRRFGIESLRTHRAVAGFFMLALLIHLSLLWVPVARHAARSIAEIQPVQVQLRREPKPKVEPVENVVPPPPAPPQQRIAESPPVAVPEPEPEPVEEPTISPRREVVRPVEPGNLTRRLLSDQYDTGRVLRKPLFSDPDTVSRETRDYVMYQSRGLDEVLNEPSLQLPFEDTRIYLVDYYDEGPAGSMQRFWDAVTVPFGWTTKNNTRVQCAWVLVIAACGWGDKRLFHREAKKRKPVEKGS